MLKKIKNKGGFTLIEILGAIVLLLILVGITIPVVSKYLKDGKDKYNDKLANEFLTVVKDYYADNPGKKPSGGFKGNISDAVWLTELQAKNYLSDELKDADGGSCYDTVGYVNYDSSTGELDYNVCLRCENYDYKSEGANCDQLGYSNQCSNGEELIKIKAFKFYELNPIIDEVTDTVINDKIEYNGRWTSNTVVFEVVTDKFGYLMFEDKKIPGVSGDEGYVYSLELNKYISEEDFEKKVSIFGSCGKTLMFDIGFNISVDKSAPEFNINGVDSYVLEPNEASKKIYNTVTGVVDSVSEVSDIKYQYCVSSDCSELKEYNEDGMLYNATQSGNYLLKVYVYDIAGNVAKKEKNIVVKNKIVYDLDGGSGEFPPVEKIRDQQVVLSNNIPKKEGYVFIGWDNKNDNSNSLYFAGSAFNENISVILTAFWKAKSSSTESTESIDVIFHCIHKGKEVSTISRTYTEGVGGTFPNCDKQDGYNYIGWSLSNDNIRVWANNISVQDYWIKNNNDSQPLNIYSVEEAKKVTVKYDCDVGEDKTSEFTYDVSGNLNPNACSKTGYVLKKWKRKKTTRNGVVYDEKQYDIDWKVSNDFKDAFSTSVTLYPVWEAKKVKVTFYCSSSTKPTQTFTYGVSGQKFSKTCSKTGLVLKGWSLQKNGVKNYNVKNDVANSWINKNSPKITLYPVWGFPLSSNKCPNDKVAPVCQLVTSCHESSSGNGVTATFKCKDADSSIKLYSIFAQTGWKESKFSTIANITSALNYKTSASKGVWKSYSPNWTTTTTPSNPPVKNKQYTFYFGAIDDCGNAIVIDNVSTSCKYN